MMNGTIANLMNRKWPQGMTKTGFAGLKSEIGTFPFLAPINLIAVVKTKIEHPRI